MLRSHRSLSIAAVLVALGAAACKSEDKAPAPSASSTSAGGATVVSSAVPTVMSASPIAVPSTVEYAAYSNPRFGFAVDYPTFIKLEAPPDNGDGQTFTYFDKIAMKAWAMHDVTHDTLDALAKNAAKEQLDSKDDPKKALTYQQKTKNGFVLSGTRGNKIFYRTEKLEKGVVYVVTVEYDASMKKEMDPIVTHVSESFVVMGPPAK